MSKFLKIMIVLLTIAAFATPVVIAEDRLSMSGQMRVRGFVKDNANYDSDDNDSAQYFDQRFRIGGTVAVAEGVSATFRLDLWDGTWGVGNNDLTDGSNQAFLTVANSAYTLKAGKMWYGLGNAQAIDTAGTGAVLAFNNLEFSYFKVSEGSTGASDDVDLFTIALKNKTDLYSGTVFAAYKKFGGTDDVDGTEYEDVYVDGYFMSDDYGYIPGYGYFDLELDDDIDDVEDYAIMALGAQATFNLDPIKLNVEVNYFDGDSDNDDTEYKGLQFYLDASTAVSEAASVGAYFAYAKGYDDDDDTVQVDNLSDDGSFLPETYSFMATLFEVYGWDNTFDPAQNGKGVIAGQLYGSFKASDDLSFRAAVNYAQPEEDDDTYESFLTGIISARYAVAANTNLDLVAAYTMPDMEDSNDEDDARLTAGFRLAVNF